MSKFWKDVFQYSLGGLITVGFFSVLILLVFREVPVSNKSAVDILLGALAGAFVGGVVGYFFGTSKSSSEKNDIIAGKKPE